MYKIYSNSQTNYLCSPNRGFAGCHEQRESGLGETEIWSSILQFLGTFAFIYCGVINWVPSLGEYTALAYSEAISVKDVLELVKKRSEIMSKLRNTLTSIQSGEIEAPEADWICKIC